MSSIEPRLDILPAEQRQLWPALRPLHLGGWVLYGGTALALRLGHRVSVDFDFFHERPIDHESLFAALPLLKQARLIQDEPNAVTWLIPVDDRTVKLSFFGTIDMGRVGTPSLTSDGVAEIASLADLLAHKLKVIMQRVESKDYRDIAALLNHGESLAAGLAAAARLFGAHFSPSECVKALGYLDDENLADLEDSVRQILINRLQTRKPLPSPPPIVWSALSAQ